MNKMKNKNNPVDTIVSSVGVNSRVQTIKPLKLKIPRDMIRSEGEIED